MTGPPPPHALRRPKLQIEVRSHRDFFIMSIQDCIRYARARFRLFRSNYFGAVGCAPKRRLRRAIMERNRAVISAGDNLAALAAVAG